MLYKLVIPLFIILIAFSSCKKESTGGGDYLEIQVAGKTYRNEIYSAGAGFSGQSGCVSKPHFLGYLSEFISTSFEFDAYISYLEADADFKNYPSGTYGVQSQSSNSICHLNLAVSFLDKSLSNSYTTLLTGGINQVSSIVKVGTTSTGVRYRIKGNFSSNFRNSAGATIPVSGNY